MNVEPWDGTPEGWGIDTLQAYRAAAVGWAWWACQGFDGARIGAEPHRTVTEGRKELMHRTNPGRLYSSCGDLVHFVLDRIGCRAPFVNRAPRWRIGQNLLLLAAHWPRAGRGVEPCGGDLVWWERPSEPGSAHVTLWLGDGGGAALSAEYGGQGPFVVGAVDGRVTVTAPKRDARGVLSRLDATGRRYVGTVYPLVLLLDLVRQAGELLPVIEAPPEPEPSWLDRSGVHSEALADLSGWLEECERLRVPLT